MPDPRLPRTGRVRPTFAIAWNAAWTIAGAGLAVANVLRHRLTGYRTPREFGPDDIARNVDYSIAVVDQWRRNGLDVSGRHVLEVGPGPDLGTGFALVALGAASYTAVDRFPLAEGAHAEFYQALGARLGADVDATLSQVRYVVGAIPTAIDPPDSFDAFVSNGTLEHLADMRSAFAWMASVAKPGAVHVHVVDAQTHMRWVRPRDPWNILRYPTGLYRLAMSFPGSPNRMLASDYVAAASPADIHLSIVAGTQIDAEDLRRVRPWLAGPFRGRGDEDLRLLTFTLVGEQA